LGVFNLKKEKSQSHKQLKQLHWQLTARSSKTDLLQFTNLQALLAQPQSKCLLLFFVFFN
jgi:hypothetical protein